MRRGTTVNLERMWRRVSFGALIGALLLAAGACSGDESAGPGSAVDAGAKDGALTDATPSDDGATTDGGVADGSTLAAADDGPSVDAPPATAVNFSKYGAVGDGVTDDTAALQAALDAEAELVADSSATFLISETLKIDQAFAHAIYWNGATVMTQTALLPMILVDKRASNGGLTAMSNLKVDGKKTAGRGVEADSRVSFINVDATGFRQPNSNSPAAFYINFYDDDDAYGTWTFDGCDADDVIGASNGVTTDSLGAANGYLIYWKAVPTSTITLDVKNATIRDCWGEDAQNVAIFSTGYDISATNSGTQWTNVKFLDWERRSIKCFAANNTFKNCSFTDPNPSDPDLYSSNKSGMVVVGAGSGATGADNQIFEGCSFNQAGYDGRVIVFDTENVQFNGCSWTGGSDILFTSFGGGGVGKVDVCSGTFGAGSTIGDYGGISYKANDVISLDTDNTYVEASYVSVNANYYQEVDLSCTP